MGRNWLSIVLGGLCLLAALVLGGMAGWRVATNQKARGSVRLDSFGRRGTSNYKIVYGSGGQSHVIAERWPSWIGLGYSDGQKVEVLHPASDPSNGVTNNFANMWLWPVLLGL